MNIDAPIAKDQTKDQTADPVRRARQLRPLIEGAATTIEQGRQVTADLQAALHEARLFRLYLPRTYGGEEVMPATFVAVVEEACQRSGVKPKDVDYAADGLISVNHEYVLFNDLETRLRAIYDLRVDKTMFIAGDGSLRYGAIIAVLDAAKGAGVDRVGIITEGLRNQRRLVEP